MTQPADLMLSAILPVKAQNAGLYVSRNPVMHPTRRIDSHELIFVKQGSLSMWEEDQSFDLEAGDCLHLWPSKTHGSTRPMETGLKFYWIHFEITEGNQTNENAPRGSYLARINVPQVVRTSQPERLERLFRAFLEDQESGVLHPRSANMLTMAMLVEVAETENEKDGNPTDVNVVATWTHNYIQINYDRQITTSKVAEALGYNADYLGRIYRKVYGRTLTESIHRRRISMACNHLLDSDLSIDQIAEKCGFSDPDYFRRIFRAQMQVTPHDFRKKYSRIHINSG